jgi:hypothetical protein
MRQKSQTEKQFVNGIAQLRPTVCYGIGPNKPLRIAENFENICEKKTKKS